MRSQEGENLNFSAQRRPLAMGPYFHIVTHTWEGAEEEDEEEEDENRYFQAVRDIIPLLHSPT